MTSENAADSSLPDREQLVRAIETAQAAERAQSTANDLKSKAQAMTDPGKREKLLKEAFDKEVEAHGHSKMAKRLQSGTWQGMGFGGGIGAATGLGLGAGVGTVLGAVTAVPATGLGMLIGSGVGAIHGPWVKLGGKEQKLEDANPDEVADALEQEQNERKKEELEQRVTASAENVGSGSNSAGDEKPRRKPKKLEIRSRPDAKVSGDDGGTADHRPRRKPKKLEIRSGKGSADVSSKPHS